MTDLKPEINQNHIYKLISSLTEDALSLWLFRGNSWYLWEVYATHKYTLRVQCTYCYD